MLFCKFDLAMDKKHKKNSSKNEKPIKKNASRGNDEKPVKPAPKPAKPSYDLPAVQCKDTLLLDYDYNKQYSKRTVSNNWDKYAEIADDDDDNGQLSAADYEQLLTASQSIGDHFTFAAERSWLQDEAVQSTDESSLAGELFKLNVANLKNGLSRIPFYVRQGLSKEMFTDEELADMDYRSNFFDSDVNQKTQKGNQMNQNLLNILSSSANEHKLIKEITAESKPIVKIDMKLPSETELAESLKTTQISKQSSFEAKPAPIPSSSGQTKPLFDSPNPSQAKSNDTNDIQDWLDDILNEN